MGDLLRITSVRDVDDAEPVVVAVKGVVAPERQVRVDVRWGRTWTIRILKGAGLVRAVAERTKVETLAIGMGRRGRSGEDQQAYGRQRDCHPT
jgi:ribosomal protein L13E